MVKKAISDRPKGLPAAAQVLTAQAWAEADQALAEALIAQWRVAAGVVAVARKAKRAGPSFDQAVEGLDAEMLGLSQAIARAAKARGLTLFGDPGIEVKFDPKRHHMARGAADKGRLVKVVTPGVAMGRVILVTAETRATRTQAKPAPPRKVRQ